jgi:glutamate N-acetyltransferase/amino-acid N-acetyltransferase
MGPAPEQFTALAEAIMTTDLVDKTAFQRIEAPGGAADDPRFIHIAGVCKGSGMIHPQLVPHATMLAYLLTDAAIAPAALQGLLNAAVNKSFNRISVDGDTSTNDTVLLLASGASGIPVEPENPSVCQEFAAALEQVCISLARQIVADGEGVTHVVELQISGAASDEDALRVAKAIAHSPLVKTAWAGADPNWGRLIAAIGYSGAQIDPARIDISFGSLPICENGGRSPHYDEKAAHDYIAQPEFTIHIDLHQGQGSCTFLTTDLTHQYVSINADYST